MRLFHRFLTLSVGVALAVAAAPVCAPADSGGLAWDSVTKIAQTTDPSSVQPGSFDSDYAAASALVVSTDSGGGGFMAKIKAAEQAMKGAAQVFQTGLAEKHYIVGSKERTDAVPYGTATIRDCGARTITTLNLRKKTYKVESMDQPSKPSGEPAGNATTPGPAPTDDGTRIALDVRNTALGAKEVAGQATQGYQSAIKMTTTKPSGEKHVANINMLAYYSKYAQPVVLCSTFAIPNVSGPPRGAQSTAMLGSYTSFLQMLAHPLSGRVSFNQSGPALQTGRLAMFDAVAFTGDNPSHGGATFVGERGNVRSISANDPAFSVPSDFTKEQ